MILFMHEDGSYYSSEEIFQDIHTNIDTSDEGSFLLKYLERGFEPPADATSETKYEYHLAKIGFGRWIRNSYGLWQEDNPHVILNPSPNDEGIIDHPLFPDNLSGTIIDRLIQHYQSKLPQVENV
ncbi:hypothetical protein EVB94_193 [Rhizobium phage RHph_TM40]|nr:hypothetical protein EVB94_193 [Rhizobium phage RHph_TM40]QIG72027.1 hypothetical protein EVB95_193 [Rhizobium phage RHph_TM2_3B]QIG77780.1 hypothetical protein EVB64_193 [Rhizobium phage RHph_TM61]